MKFAILMPHRGDRPKFLEQFHRIVQRQTVQPEIVEIVDYEPLSNACDITQRYKVGYDNLRNKGLDAIIIFENDDYYSNNYCEVMLNAWNAKGRPNLFGIDHTIYYHLAIHKSFTFKHDKRASMMSTLIKPDMDFNWPQDDYAYTDSFLWKELKGTTFNPRQTICVGLKHGIGLSGGRWHSEQLQRYKDTWLDFRKVVGEEDYSFYLSIYDTKPQVVRSREKGLYLYAKAQ